MKLKFTTLVQASPEEIWQKFDRDLFQRMAPPFPRVRLLRFDGCRKGDVVEVELNFWLFRQHWFSEIVHQLVGPDEIYFITEGVHLPFFLRSWVHKHRIMRCESGTQIVDDIDFSSGWRIIDWFVYPLMWLQVAYRTRIYRRAFRKR